MQSKEVIELEQRYHEELHKIKLDRDYYIAQNEVLKNYIRSKQEKVFAGSNAEAKKIAEEIEETLNLIEMAAALKMEKDQLEVAS